LGGALILALGFAVLLLYPTRAASMSLPMSALKIVQSPESKVLSPFSSPVAHDDAWGTALKMDVAVDGFYRLTYADLAQAGFPVDQVDPRQLQVTVGGVEVAIWAPGQEDGTFDAGDWLLFYGQGLHTIYTGANVYWLRAGTGPGLRMATRPSVPDGQAPAAQSFTTTVHAEVNSFYWQTMPLDLGPDHWFWGAALTAPASRQYEVQLPGLVSGAAAQARVRLQGLTSAPATPDHSARLQVNGTTVGEQTWSGLLSMTLQGAIAGGVAQPGANVVGLEAISITGYASQTYLDWIEIDYQRRYTAENDFLAFTGPAPGRYAFRIQGFSGNDPALFDVTDARRPLRVTGVETGTDTAGVFVRFADELSPNSQWAALTSLAYRTPTLHLDAPSAWRSDQQGADYILLTYKDFVQAVAPLAEHRRAQGLRVAVVDVEDVYDEFSDGVFDPAAIRDFLSYAYHNWQPPRPRYVLLVGDGNQDYRDYLDTGVANTMPAQIVHTTILGETPSDNWYVAVEGDDPVPEMSIGRLSARNVADVETMVAKLLAYESALPGVDWGRRVLLVADDDSTDFETLSEKLAAQLPVGLVAERLYMRPIAGSERAARIAAALDAGALLVNYSGHGSPRHWGSRNAAFFGPAEIAALHNGPRLPVVTVANCLNGFFTDPIAEGSLAEQMQRLPHGGAIAVFAPTGLHYPAGHEELFKAFYAELLAGDGVTLGQAMDRAKARIYAQDPFWGELLEMYVLFGDPAMPLRVPAGPVLYLPTVRGK